MLRLRRQWAGWKDWWREHLQALLQLLLVLLHRKRASGSAPVKFPASEPVGTPLSTSRQQHMKQG